MRGTASSRAAPFFLLTFALGEFLAFALASKSISYRRGGALELAIN
jgi:hypothetical protein